MFLTALPLLFALSAAPSTPPVKEPPWELSSQDDGLMIYTREKPGSAVHEMKAQGFIDAPAPAVFKALRDYAHYDQTMPYTEESKVLGSSADGKVIYFYSVVNAPFVSRRDYVIKCVDASDWKDGKGYMKVTWSTTNEKQVPPRDGIVRVTVNEGYWYLQPIANGTRTYATYYLYTDPGGSLPKWIVNKANSSAIPDVFKAVSKQAAKWAAASAKN